MHILDSLLAFSAYFFIGVAMVIIFLFIYSKITPHNEWQLIKNNNTAAALAFSGTLLGYVIPLSSAAINAVSIPDYFAWGGIALVIQLLVDSITRFCCVRLYHNTAAGMFMTIPQQECLWEPPRWLAGWYFYGNRRAGWRYF